MGKKPGSKLSGRGVGLQKNDRVVKQVDNTIVQNPFQVLVGVDNTDFPVLATAQKGDKAKSMGKSMLGMGGGAHPST